MIIGWIIRFLEWQKKGTRLWKDTWTDILTYTRQQKKDKFK